MGILKFIGFVLFIILLIAIILLTILYFFDNSLFNSIICTNLHLYCNNNSQTAFVSNETKAIASSSPIPIKNYLVFGTGKSVSQRICRQQQIYFSLENSSNLYVLSNGYYVPTYEVVKAIGNYAPNLIGQKVYLDFIDINVNLSACIPFGVHLINIYPHANLSTTYIVKNESIQNNEVIWNMTFDGNISNAIIPNTNTQLSYTIFWLNGVILTNETALISPKNPFIDDGNFIAPNC